MGNFQKKYLVEDPCRTRKRSD